LSKKDLEAQRAVKQILLDIEDHLLLKAGEIESLQEPG